MRHFLLQKYLKRFFSSVKNMGRPIEIEFAVELNPDEDNKRTFYLLQIRPIVDIKEMLEEDIDNIPADQLIIKSNNALDTALKMIFTIWFMSNLKNLAPATISLQLMK